MCSNWISLENEDRMCFQMVSVKLIQLPSLSKESRIKVGCVFLTPCIIVMLYIVVPLSYAFKSYIAIELIFNEFVSENCMNQWKWIDQNSQARTYFEANCHFYKILKEGEVRAAIYKTPKKIRKIRWKSGKIRKSGPKIEGFLNPKKSRTPFCGVIHPSL